ncbi:MAG: lytic transglycosylase domain-containing protein [Geminicoccaceae bacterium]|nr:lytic transglycosylase domain-containing protein [Geminicoccaceae bacterium]
MHLARLNPATPLPTRLGTLPRPLAVADAVAYRAIFALQAEGRMAAADRLVRDLKDPMLMGHVLAQRYLHPTAYVTTYAELRDWLDAYADHPDAPRIYDLALRKKGRDDPLPPNPIAGFLAGSGQELIEEMPIAYPGPSDRPTAATGRVRAWLAKVRALVGRDRPSAAAKLLDAPAARLADTVERDIARWYVARGYFANRKDTQSYRFAAIAADRSGHVEPRLHWTAGLAAWRLGDYETAGRHFGLLAESETTAEDVAAGAFWAARAYLRIRQPERHRRYLAQAAGMGDCFYSLLAQALVGDRIRFDWREDALQDGMLRLLSGQPGALRAMALGQVGEAERAEAEIRKLAARAKPNLTQALAALAETLRLPAAQMRVAQRLRIQDGHSHDGALYPVPPWSPLGGFDVDRALLFALVRAESGFDPLAKSHAGAHGVMQILPATAAAMAKRRGLPYAGEADLLDPVVNLTLGQAYVRRLLDTGFIGGDLIKTALAYNAGLKRMGDWAPRFDDIDDPLLYLESVPVPETRLYAKKVLSNIWAYQTRLGLPVSSLNRLAEGKWPIYQDQDPVNPRYAAN